MTSDRPYGKPEGLADRLETAAGRLARDKSMPWLGCGLHDDLLCAARILRGKPLPTPPKPPMEFDL